MRFSIWTFVVASALGLVAAPIPGLAQEPPPSQFEHIEGLESFVGFWEAELPEEAGGPVSLTCQLAGNQSYLRMQLISQSDGQRETIGMMLIGRDHAKDQVSYWGFWPDQQTHGKVTVRDGTATWSETGTRLGGDAVTGNVSMTVDGDTLTVDVTDVKHGDQEQPEMHITFTRSERRGRGGQ